MAVSGYREEVAAADKIIGRGEQGRKETGRRGRMREEGGKE